MLQFELSGTEIANHQIYQNEPGDENSLSENFILSLMQDENNSDILWLGTKGGGLNRFSKSEGSFFRITSEDGLPNNVVYGILPYGNNLWLSTNRGLAVFNKTNNQITSYTEKEGLQSEEFNTFAFLKTSRNRLIFGGINGIHIFSPDDIKDNKVKPTTVITAVKVNNQSVSGFKGYSLPLGNAVLQLSHDENIMTFRYAALDFTEPSKNVFKYKLSGVYDDWVFADNLRELTFTNLAPGSYIFEVLGTNNSGLWSEIPAIFQFKISPPWWQTTLAYIFYFLLAIIIAFGVIHYRISRFRLKNQLIFEQKEAERLLEMDKIKTGFFSNITHEFRTPLTLIL